MNENDILNPQNGTDFVLSDTELGEDTAAPVQVISVDELLERLAGDDQETQQAGDGETVEPVEAVPADWLGREEIMQLLATATDLQDHPMMTTRFSDYTVTEGLLLMALLLSIFHVFARWVKGGFSWLLS